MKPHLNDIHYMFPPLGRLPRLDRLILQRSYFVIHAPRQVGKIISMMALTQQLTSSEQHTPSLACRTNLTYW